MKELYLVTITETSASTGEENSYLYFSSQKAAMTYIDNCLKKSNFIITIQHTETDTDPVRFSNPEYVWIGTGIIEGLRQTINILQRKLDYLERIQEKCLS